MSPSAASSPMIPESLAKPNFRKDIRAILLLFLLYILQGVPLGLIQTVPFLLQSMGVHYKDQAQFSLAGWPFSLKVLYAPIVDAIYWKRLGRRKSWLIPLQYLISIFFFILAFRVDALFAAKDVPMITAMFFMLNFLAASQDVAVDGWALTMLSPENVGFAATCNSVGLTLGAVMGYSGFMTLQSAGFANTFRSVPLDHGFVTLPQFLLFWAIIFAITTTLILIFKAEKKESREVSAQHMDIVANYRNLWRILKLRNIRTHIVFLFTVRIGMATMDALTKLKLVEQGVSKEVIAFFSIPMIPLKLLIPIFAAKWTVGSSPMRLFINTIPFTLCLGLVFPLVVFWTPTFKSETGGEYSFWFYVFLFGIFVLELIPHQTRTVTNMGFAAKVSDPAMGGTYMTLLNTFSNIGAIWPTSLALYLVDYVKIPLGKDCPSGETLFNGTTNGTVNFDIENSTMSTYSPEDLQNTNMTSNVQGGPPCVSYIDGYYVESVVFVAIGFLWLIWGRPTILRLQRKPASTWKVLLGSHQR